MLTREEIISSYKEAKFPTKLFDESISKIKNIIFYDKSTQPSSGKLKDAQKLSESYVLPRRILFQKNIQPNQNNKNEFIRGGNFTPKEPIIDIEIDNFKLIYDKFSLPLETNIIYLKNTYGGINGPFNFEHIKNLYKNKKIDSNSDFRLIDIYSFKDAELFSFQSLKVINDKKWTDLIVDNPLINYSELFKNQKKEEEKKEIINEIKEIEPKIEESEGKWEVAKKKKKVKSKEIKEEKEKKDKIEKIEKEENKNEKKENVDSSEKLDIKINKEKKENNEELVEILKRKKKEKEKEKQIEEKKELEKENIKDGIDKEDEKKEDKKENEIKEIRTKKGKKKKKAQFEETEIDLGFQVK